MTAKACVKTTIMTGPTYGLVASIPVRVLELLNEHAGQWDDKDDLYWQARLTEEMGEFASAVLGRHEHSQDYELAQIASIAINLLVKHGAATVKMVEDL